MAEDLRSLPLLDPDGEAGRLLSFGVAHPERPGITITRAAADRFTSVHREVLSVGVRPAGPERLDRELPGTDPAELTHLDERAVVRVGTSVRSGNVLVGRVRPYVAAEVSKEERVLRVAQGSDSRDRDVSLRVPPDLRGTVTRADLTQGPDGVRVEVEITEHRRLRVGDLLATPEGARSVVAEIVESLGGADVTWPGVEPGRRRVLKRSSAEADMEARSIGPYSLVTQQPLAGKVRFGGQRVGEAELCALEARGAWCAAWEMVTVKSDDVFGRTRLYEAIVTGKPLCEASVPEATQVLRAELTALGLEVELVGEEAPVVPEPVEPRPAPEPDGGSPSASRLHDIFSFFEKPRSPDNALPWRISPSTPDQVRRRSQGEVRSPATLDERTRLPEPDGLFCERLFGPVQDYRCRCGRYSRMRNRGVRCEVCGVEVISSKVRRERFAHVELQVPVLHPWMLPTAAQLLGVDADVVHGVLYEGLTLDGQVADDAAETGGRALAAALDAVDLDALAGAPGPRGALARRMMEGGTGPADLIYDAWPVLPPDLRPMIPLDDGRWATSDLNDLYRQLIDRNDRLRRLFELNAPAVVMRGEQIELQIAVDRLVQNGLRHPSLTFDGRVLRSLHEMLAGARGRFAANLLGKRVDYSGQTVVVPAPELPDDLILLPRDMARELFRPWIYEELEAEGHVQSIKGAKALVDAGDARVEDALDRVSGGYPVLVFPAPPPPPRPPPTSVAGLRLRLWDEPAVGLGPAALRALGLSPGGDRVTVHVPVDPRAVSETREIVPARVPPPASGVLHRRLRGLVVREEACGAATREVATCLSPGGPCAACSGFPVGTAIGLRAADALAPHEERVLSATSARELASIDVDPRYAAVAFRTPPAGWVARAASAGALWAVLVEAALGGEMDPIEDPLARSILGRLGWPD